jgi:hypothetical protein
MVKPATFENAWKSGKKMTHKKAGLFSPAFGK